MVNFTAVARAYTSSLRRSPASTSSSRAKRKKPGKRFEWETAQASEIRSPRCFRYDWADEVLHAKLGRDWYVSQFENPKEAVSGGQGMVEVLVGWGQWGDEGLTEHRNWWPDVCLDYCRVRYEADAKYSHSTRLTKRNAPISRFYRPPRGRRAGMAAVLLLARGGGEANRASISHHSIARTLYVRIAAPPYRRHRSTIQN
jgi:hypothetical protein